MRWTKNKSGPERFLSTLDNHSPAALSFFGFLQSETYFVISNAPLITLMCAKLLKKKIVLRVDGFSLAERYQPIQETRIPSRQFSFKRMKMNYSMAITQAYADVVVFQSLFSQEMSQRHIYPRLSNSHVIYNAVDIDHFKTPKTPKSPVAISVVGNFRDVDLMEFYLACFQQVRTTEPSATLDIIGKLNEDVSRLIQSYPRDKKQNVTFTGKYSYAELPQLLSASNIGWHFTLWDWCPNSVLEQMACGNPIICSKLGGTKELVGETGIILDINSLDLTNKNLEIVQQATLDMKSNLHNLQPAVVNRIGTQFHPAIMTKKYDEVFNTP